VRSVTVEHRPELKMFLIRLEPGKHAFLSYTLERDRVCIKSTFVPPEYRGRGLAAKLMEAVITWARSQRLLVVPICSYAVYYFKKHREAWDVLAPESLETVKSYEHERA